MTRLHRLVSIVRWIVRRDRAERDLHDEIDTFIDMAAADRMRGGTTPGDARRQAVIELGGVEQTKARVRSERHGARLDEAGRDLRFALRMCVRNPGFSALAILTLALGIAGAATMFALVQGVLLRPLPVLEQDRLVVAWREARTSDAVHYPFGSATIDEVARAGRLFTGTAGVARNGIRRSVVTENGIASYVGDALVTGRFFGVLGVDALLGRTLRPEDDLEGAEPVLVISHGLWQRRYGASREVIGRRVMLEDQPFTIVGVMPPDVDYPAGVEAWRTPSTVSVSGPFGDAARSELDLVARLRPGVTIEQAGDELTALAERVDADAAPDVVRGLSPVVRSFEDVVVGDVRTALAALFAAVGLVLLIAGANVANLLLMRGEARRAEFAVRSALGAERGRIVRQLIIESSVLAMAACAAGLALACWSLEALIVLAGNRLPRTESIRIDATVVLFSTIVAFLTALITGLAPVVASMKADVLAQLRGAGRGVSGTGAGGGRRMLVVAQVALAVTLVAGAGLLARSVLRLQSVDLGLAAERLVLVNLAMPPLKYAERGERSRFLDEVVSRLESVPAIAAATPVNVSPFTGQGWDLPRFTADGQSADQVAANPSLNLESVHPNYFEAFEVPLVRGRAFSAADREGSLPVAIISADVAARTWPGEDPLGKRLRMGGFDGDADWFTVVGVAAPTRYREVTGPRATLYLPAEQFQMTAEMLVLRTTASLDLVAALARDRIREIDADVPVVRVAHFNEMLAVPLARPRFNAFLLGMFGVTALLLSAVGLYGVMAASVRHRDREIAVRLALGATAATVQRFVLAEALWLAGLGAAIGLLTAVAAGRVLQGLLFEVSPLDPAAILGAALLVLGASALASYLPARQATRVKATAALHSE